MTQHGSEAGQHRDFPIRHGGGKQHGNNPLETIQQHRCGGQLFPSGAQHVGRADIS